jgi:hypothetical protein
LQQKQTTFAALSRQNRKFGLYHYTSVMRVRSESILEKLSRCLAQKSSGKLGRLNIDTPLILFQTRSRSDALAVITTLLALSVTQRLTLARSRRSFAFTMKQATWLKHTSTRAGRKFAPGSLLLAVYSPPRNCSHQALPFVEAAAKAKLAVSIET